MKLMQTKLCLFIQQIHAKSSFYEKYAPQWCRGGLKAVVGSCRPASGRWGVRTPVGTYLIYLNR